MGKEKEEKRASLSFLSPLSLSGKKNNAGLRSGPRARVVFTSCPASPPYTGCWMLFFSGWGAILGLEKGLKIAAERVSGSRLWRKCKLPPLSLPRWLATPLVVASSVAVRQPAFLASGRRPGDRRQGHGLGELGLEGAAAARPGGGEVKEEGSGSPVSLSLSR